MIWNREQYIAHCQFEYTGREMFCELFGPLVGLDAEWRAQGASEKEIGMTAFDWDYVMRTSLSGSTGAHTGLKKVILEDTPEYTISRDTYGRKMKLIKSSATLPLPMEHPVKTMDDWLKIKHWYTFSENRVNREALLQQKALYDKGYLTIFSVRGGFDEPRQLLGEEALCYAFYDEPEMIEDMLTTMADTAVKVIERVGDIVPIDNLIIHEDMAGKSGPLLGPSIISEFIAPYYKKVWAAAQAQGAKLFSQDSDGNMEAVIDVFLDAGVNCFYPCEPAAGMDMVQLRKKYGKQFYIKGGIDKHVLRRDKDAIRAELEYKMAAPMLGGGTIFALDHRIPNGVPIENYRYYVKLGRELLGLPPVSGEGWERMAF
ncbi:MAG: hypothetical protein E7662_01295 [Ruminococcaceae bacterium]|nr:hypothetical protein [Oscillospiraceae bacterium]